MYNKEDCKLISEFTLENIGVAPFYASMYEQLERNKKAQWVWLMDAVNAIESCRDENGNAFRFHITQSVVDIDFSPLIFKHKSSKRKAVYDAIVKFIRWYKDMGKKFMCWWDGDYYMEDKDGVKDSSFFNTDNGYREEDIESVLKLAVGEVSLIGKGHHIVTRVK